MLREEAERAGVELSAVAYVGNDVNDASCLEAVGLPVVPADAWPEVVPLARWVLDTPAGVGASGSSATRFGAPGSVHGPSPLV